MTEKKVTAKKATAPKTAGTQKKRRTKAQASSWTLDGMAQYIKDHAYYIWENEGRPEKKDFDIWLRAEREAFATILK